MDSRSISCGIFILIDKLFPPVLSPRKGDHHLALLLPRQQVDHPARIARHPPVVFAPPPESANETSDVPDQPPFVRELGLPDQGSIAKYKDHLFSVDQPNSQTSFCQQSAAEEKYAVQAVHLRLLVINLRSFNHRNKRHSNQIVNCDLLKSICDHRM